jgi:hypothetical protein
MKCCHVKFFGHFRDITFQILIAALQIAIFFWTVGRKPSDVPVAIMNDAYSLCDLIGANGTTANLLSTNTSCWPFVPAKCAPIPTHLQVIKIVSIQNIFPQIISPPKRSPKAFLISFSFKRADILQLRRRSAERRAERGRVWAGQTQR